MVKDKKQVINKAKRLDRIVLCVTLLVVFLAIGLYSWWFYGGGVLMGSKEAMEKHLTSRYNKGFEVSNLIFHSGSLGGDVKDRITATAKPKDGSSEGFEVIKYSNRVEDDYLSALWTKQESERVESFIKNNLHTTDGYSLSIMPDHRLYDKDLDYNIDFNKMKQAFPDYIRYEITIKNTVEEASDNSVSKKEADRAFQLFNFVKEININNYEMNYLYKSKSFIQKDETGNALYQYSFRVDNISGKSIKSTDDIASFDRKLR